jgi:hypothetical protein
VSGISPVLVRAPDVGFDQHQTRNLGRVTRGKGTHVIAAEGMPDQDVRSPDAGMVKRAA